MPENSLQVVERAKAQVRILNTDFEEAIATAKPGAFIYLDPPYHSLSDTSSFTGYSMQGF